MNMELLYESEQQFQHLCDSQNQSFQPSYSPFQKELSELEKSMKDMIQTQNIVTQFIGKLEVQISQLVNIIRNEKTLSYQPLTNPDISNSIDLTQELWCFENQDLILAQPFELDQN